MQRLIIDMLAGAAARTRVRYNMPGHKGRDAFLPGAVNMRDITEIAGADNLYCPEGVILASQRQYADFVGARSARYLVNGTTSGVQASMLAALRPGDKVIVARDLHVSAAHAMILADARPVFVVPRRSGGPLPGVVTPEQMERAIRRHTDAKAVYVTYPNYYGQCVDLETIAAMAHEAGMLLICDAAHAAAFDFSTKLPASPASCSCDLWTVSLHKTLPANNQCAALFAGTGCRLPEGLIQSRLNWIQTTSPSYLLLASSEFAVTTMREKGEEMIARALGQASVITRNVDRMGYKALTKDVPYSTGAYDRDPLRLVIDVSRRGITGIAAARELSRMGVHVEAADMSSLILICSPVDTNEDAGAFLDALRDMRGGLYSIEQTSDTLDVWSLCESEMAAPMRQAAMARRESVPISACDGRIAATCIGLYPPGVPAYMPGQRLSMDRIRVLERLRKNGYGTFGFGDTVEVAAMEPYDGYNARPIS